MRSPVAAALAAAVLAGSAAAAAADVTLVKGGPRADKARAQGELDAAAAAMSVCWRQRGPGPAKVRVKLDVAADGSVTAAAVGKGGAAQCAAGVLAVWTLSGGPWSGEVEIGAAAGGGDLGAIIQAGLLAKSAPVKACQAKAPAAAGPADITMLIHPDGSITEVAVSSSLGAAIDGCVTRAVGAIRLGALPSTGVIKYRLVIAFAGKGEGDGGGGGAGPAAPVEAPEGGTVGGALEAGQVKPVMAGAKARLLACGKKGKTKGTVVTRFTIRPDGTTKNVVIKQPIGDAAIEACLVGVYKALTFPTAGADTKVSYPVVFR